MLTIVYTVLLRRYAWIVPEHETTYESLNSEMKQILSNTSGTFIQTPFVRLYQVGTFSLN